MTKRDIINKVAKETRLTKATVFETVNAVFDVLREALADGERIEIRGFGVFEVKERKPRMARNPKTGEPAEVKRGKRVRFKASTLFKTK